MRRRTRRPTKKSQNSLGGRRSKWRTSERWKAIEKTCVSISRRLNAYRHVKLKVRSTKRELGPYCGWRVASSVFEIAQDGIKTYACDDNVEAGDREQRAHDWKHDRVLRKDGLRDVGELQDVLKQRARRPIA